MLGRGFLFDLHENNPADCHQAVKRVYIAKEDGVRKDYPIFTLLDSFYQAIYDLYITLFNEKKQYQISYEGENYCQGI
jgi:hypothetical protein